MKTLKYVLKAGILNKVIGLTLSLFFVLSPSSYASFEKAMDIYESGKLVEAKSAFEAMAAIGDRSSLFNLGVMYYRGEIGEKDAVTAYVLMKISNEGLEDEAFTKTTKAVFRKLTEEQKIHSEVVYAELVTFYSIKNIRENIFPKPLSDEDCEPKYVPLKKVPAVYPKHEARNGHMGLTRTEFTISPEGYPRDIIITNSTSREFSRSSITSIKKSTYAPTVNNAPIYEHRVNFIFQVSKNYIEVKTEVLERELDGLEVAANSGDMVAQYKYGYKLNSFRYFRSYIREIDLEYSTANEWFTKSAKSGLPHAQFEIGRNMLVGRGCEVDRVNGHKWINAAAVGGYSPAQRSLAQFTLGEKELSQKKSLAAISWLRSATMSNSFPAKILLAWELATSAEEGYRNGDEALTLIKEKNDNYFDDLRILETKAAAYAELGKFKKAVKFQKKAIKMAKKLSWTISLIHDRLALYEQGKAYRGSYY